MPGLTLLGERLAVCRLDPEAPVPDWSRGELVSITRTPEELSLVCDEAAVPDGEARAERGWWALKVDGPLDFSLTGVIASLSGALADAGVPLFALSTYDTDYLLVREGDLERALAALEDAGHTVRR